MSYEVVVHSGNGASLEALERVYRGCYRRFLRVVLAIVGDRETAAEVVQEAFARAVRGRDGFRGRGSVEAWVWAIVLNAARSAARARPPETGVEPPERAGLHEDTYAWPELRAAVAGLPERQRLAVFLRHYGDLSYDEIASTLQVERGTVAATLHAAHTTLRKQMSEVLHER